MWYSTKTECTSSVRKSASLDTLGHHKESNLTKSKYQQSLDMKPPDNVKSLQSFLGLVKYLTRHSRRLATLSAPLRDLPKKDTAYSWGPEHNRAFTMVKKEVSSLGALSYYDLHAETVIETDASPKGLGTVLLQYGQPVCYASKALTKTEQ